MVNMPHQLWLIRHGETAWSLSGAHTGRTDLPLTAEGEKKAAALRAVLAGQNFKLVLTSPMQRARRTCELAGLGATAQVEPESLRMELRRLRRTQHARHPSRAAGLVAVSRRCAERRTDRAGGGARPGCHRSRTGRGRRCRAVCPRTHPAHTGRVLARPAAEGRATVFPGNGGSVAARL